MLFIYNKETNSARECSCREVRIYKKRLEKSGISEVFLAKTFDTFETRGKEPIVGVAKKMAMDYVEKFDQIKAGKHNSIAFLKQVGSGKTHLTIAIANELMKKQIGVLYMQYREVITYIKQNMLDEEVYQKELAKYQTCSVLLLDDLFKGVKKNGQINESDINIMFEIINHRYMKGLPIILSSEYEFDELLDFDEAIGSRLLEMCRGHIIQFKGRNLNHRLAL